MVPTTFILLLFYFVLFYLIYLIFFSLLFACMHMCVYGCAHVGRHVWRPEVDSRMPSLIGSSLIETGSLTDLEAH